MKSTYIASAVDPASAADAERKETTLRLVPLLLALAATLTLSGCELIGNIFQAGMWVGIILVVGVIALVIWAVTKLRR